MSTKTAIRKTESQFQREPSMNKTLRLSSSATREPEARIWRSVAGMLGILAGCTGTLEPTSQEPLGTIEQAVGGSPSDGGADAADAAPGAIGGDILLNPNGNRVTYWYLHDIEGKRYNAVGEIDSGRGYVRLSDFHTDVQCGSPLLTVPDATSAELTREVITQYRASQVTYFTDSLDGYVTPCYGALFMTS